MVSLSQGKKTSVNEIKEIFFSTCHKLFKAFKVPKIFVGFCCFLEMFSFDQFQQLSAISDSIFNKKTRFQFLAKCCLISKDRYFSTVTFMINMNKKAYTNSSTEYYCWDITTEQMFLHRCSLRTFGTPNAKLQEVSVNGPLNLFRWYFYNFLHVSLIL